MADTIFTYENVKNNKEIRNQWRKYILQRFSDKSNWPLLTQILGDSLTPESFNTINKRFGAPATYEDRLIDTTPLRPPLMRKSAQQTPNNQTDFVPAVVGPVVEPVVEPVIQNDKTSKPVVVTGGQPSPNQQPQKAGNKNKPGKKPRMSDDEIDAFLNEELGGNTTDGTYASSGVPKGGTKTIGYDLNPGNVSLAYAMRNAPEQERRAALIDELNQEHGISYVTGKDGLIYRIDPQHPNGYVDPFKNDLSKIGSIGYATGKGMLTSSSNSTYATGEGIKDANGNVLTNPGGGVDYQYALKHPEYGLVIRGRMSEPQKDYLQAVSNNMGYNYNF